MNNSFTSTKKSDKWVILLFVLISAFISIYYSDFHNLLDESAHFGQVERIRTNNGLAPLLTTIPGFHFMVSKTLSVFGLYEIQYARIVSLIFGLVGVFFLKNILQNTTPHSDGNYLKSISIYTIPIIFPFLFVFYTDLTALTFVLACFYFSIKKNYLLGSIIGLLSIGIRQTNVLWIFFVYLYVLLEHLDGEVSKEKLLAFIKPSIGYAVCAIAFIVFVFINDGVAMGDKSMHPPFALSLGNPIFFLFSFSLLLFPYCMSKLKDVVTALEDSYYLWFVAICLFIVIFFNCNFDHPYNQGNFVIRNMIFNKVEESVLVRLIFCAISTYGALVIITSKLKNASSYVLYPVFLLLISSSILVEVRYIIIGFVFFMILLNEKFNFKTQLVYNTFINVACWYGITNGLFFL